jgi:Zn finger protein HypA/HybF involved in hydrogenase expression
MKTWKVTAEVNMDASRYETVAEDVAPVVHAKWEDGRCTNCHTDKPVVMASVVQGYMHQYQGRLNYCPNCGAKMMEEEK